jgi:hypothetical protein
MKCSALALAALVALPLAAEAQTRPVYTPDPHPQQLPFSRFAVTPFVGVNVPFILGTYTVVGDNGEQLVVEEQREGSPVVGLNLDVALNRVFGVTAGAAYNTGANDIFTFGTPGDSAAEGRFGVGAPDMVLLKAGVTARLPDPVPDERRFHPSAFVTVAPALVFVESTPLQGSTRAFALNIGADATTRIGRSGWALQLGLEDYITFWNDEDFVERDAALFAGDPRFAGEPVRIFYGERSPTLLVARLGVSYRPGGQRARPADVPRFAPPPVAATPPADRPLRVCVVQDGRLADVAATYSAQRADTLVGDRTLAQAHPAEALPYAGSQPWFINNEPIAPAGRRFVKYGLPRVLPAGELRPAGEYRGVPIFAEAGGTGETRVFYVPVRPGCEFQPYQTETVTGGVRGE